MMFEQADKLCDKIMSFLIECGGPYRKVNHLVQRNIMLALGSGQFVIKINKGGIQYFGCYWRIQPEEVPIVTSFQTPQNITEGPIIYVAELGSKIGMSEPLERLKNRCVPWQGVLWFRHGKGLKVFSKQHREVKK